MCYPLSIFRFGIFKACENIRFSSLFAAGNVSRGGTSATQRQKLHTDDANQCFHNKSGSHGVPNINLSNFACLLVNFGEVLCSSANELQQNSNGFSFFSWRLTGFALCNITPIYRNIIKVAVSHKTRKKLCC